MAVKWPTGVRSGAVAAGIKPAAALDVGLIATEQPCVWAGTFTQNAAAAAPVLWSKARLSSPVRAVIVNSGNANACTGPEGEIAVESEAAAVATELGCAPEEVLVASTGPIGIPLPVEKIVATAPALAESLAEDPNAFANSILTTDTTIKRATASAGDATIVGVAKGAAMLAPNMATMLAFVATDASVDAGTLQKVLDVAVDQSFNRISVDACESTNDSVFMLATGAAGEVPLGELTDAVTSVCKQLAEAMVRDAEGGSRFVRVFVEGATGDGHACELARAVASSNLWKAAVHGGDPNWGRIAAALGAVDQALDLGALVISLNEVALFTAGAPTDRLSEARAAMAMGDITVGCVVGPGPGRAEFLTSDLSPDYVTLNAEGTT